MPDSLFPADRVNYILRTYLDPAKLPRRLDEIVRFCDETDTRHVMLFTDAQYLVWNQLTIPETRAFAEHVTHVAARLKAEGIRFGINSSYNMAQCRADHRHRLPYDHWATPESGVSTYQTPCLLDPKIEDWMAQFYAILTATGPDYIHIDDDHRYILQGNGRAWGCFCDLHIARFAARTGAPWTRPRLVAALRTEQDVRRAWIEFLGERLVELAAVMERTVHAVDPDVRVGMMVPCVHSLPAMGHTITNVLDAMSGPLRPLVRPCIGPYPDRDRRQIMPGLFYMQVIHHILGDAIDYTPEIETSPGTRLAKSMATVRFHITQALLLGMNAPALTVCSYVGDSPFIEPAWGPMLRNERPFFEAIRELAPAAGTGRGVQFTWSFDAPKLTPGVVEHVTELQWPVFVCHDILDSLGIAHTYAERPVKWLAGDSVRALSRKRIEAILGQGLILDAVAAAALAEMGYGEDIGVTGVESLADTGGERGDDPEFCGDFAGDYIPHHSVRLASVRRLRPIAGARQISTLVNHDVEPCAPGVLLTANARGGRVAVLPYAVTAVDADLRHFVCYQRREMLRRVLAWLDPAALPVWVETPTDIAVQAWEESGRWVVCLTNASYDIAEELRVRFADASLEPGRARWLDRDGQLRPLDATRADGLWSIRHRLPIFDPLILILEKS